MEEISDARQTVGGEASGDAAETGETATQQEPPRALGLELVKSPQDGSADAVVSLVLGSSYVIYHVAALARLQDFFRTEQVCGICQCLKAACSVMQRFYAHDCQASRTSP